MPLKGVRNPRAKIADDGRRRRRREEHFTAAAQSVSISSVCYRSMMMKMMTKTT